MEKHRKHILNSIQFDAFRDSKGAIIVLWEMYLTKIVHLALKALSEQKAPLLSNSGENLKIVLSQIWPLR